MAASLSLVLLALVQASVPAWRISDAPIQTIGGSDATGPSELSSVYTATFWGDRLALVDGATQTIRIFDPVSGRHIASFGRKGQGPG